MNTADATGRHILSGQNIDIDGGAGLDSDRLMELTADIVGAYVGQNNIPPAELPNLIRTVSEALSGSARKPEPQPEPQTPAVPIKKSVQEDRIFCLECGKPQLSLKRHLGSAHGLTPQGYREKWKLPHDYPMAAPQYSARRSELARSMGLGRKSNPDEEAFQPQQEPAKKARQASAGSSEKKGAPRGRRKKTGDER